ncbi:hypothetical protein N7504_011252 [Penicillium tannophilum]|nr:hypothetical protein N7504_011252 [Penicillium tannophilum]
MAESSTEDIFFDSTETLNATADTTDHGCQTELTAAPGGVYPNGNEFVSLKTFVDNSSPPASLSEARLDQFALDGNTSTKSGTSESRHVRQSSSGTVKMTPCDLSG